MAKSSGTVVSRIFNHTFELPQELFLVKDTAALDFVVEVVKRIQKGEDRPIPL